MRVMLRTSLVANNVEAAIDDSTPIGYYPQPQAPSRSYGLEDADVLAKVKNVDGAGSGLDADLLDGNSSAFYATASSVSDHLGDTTDAHDASAISYLGSTNLAATEVEAALDELDTEKASTGSVTTVQTNLDNHLSDAVDAHDASAVSFSPLGASRQLMCRPQ